MMDLNSYNISVCLYISKLFSFYKVNICGGPTSSDMTIMVYAMYPSLVIFVILIFNFFAGHK